jgi:hypothetical protein
MPETAPKQEITKEQFETYVKIQHSGVTNMFALTAVVALSKGKLSREDCLDIMENYGAYSEKFGIE